ncbi:MAG: lipid A export permease/ATP-binding protein MsbA [Gammaproteobacteria bacterium 28-57-27]|nr:MAG: lipid A export permease/ATP-binding protein MsbA [Gammaproteobacteria bacterium 28-57-27]
MSEKASSPAVSGLDTYRRLLAYVRPHRMVFALAIIGMIGASLTDVAFAALIKPLLDGSFVARDMSVGAWIPWAIIGIFLVRGVSEFAAKYGMTWVARQVISTLRQQVFEKFMRLPSRFFDHAQSGDLLARLTYTVEQVAAAATEALTVLVRDGLSVIGLLAWMFWISPQLALFILVLAPIVGLLVSLISRHFRRYSRRIQTSVGELAQVSDEVVGGHKLVKLYGGEAYEQARFAEVNERNRVAVMKMEAVSATSTPFVQLLVALSVAALVAFATSGERLEVLTVGTFISFLTALAMILEPIKRLTNLNAMLQKGIAASEQLFQTLDETEERNTASDTLAAPQQPGRRVQFANISFSYREAAVDSTPVGVLHGIELDVVAGSTVAIVGQSGSGKSTLLNLLTRFYEPNQGRILLDGVDIQSLELNHLRAQFAWVGQEVTLFDDSVANNIAYGSMQGAPREAIVRAAELAQASEFIQALPQGFDTRVGERGVLLSGGQRQRIAIARALLKNAPILLLDEATSALDTASERMIQSALDNLLHRCTTFIVAHRLSTIQKADVIVVMHAGKIVEQGRHEDLLAQDGAYARLYRLQFNAA